MKIALKSLFALLSLLSPYSVWGMSYLQSFFTPQPHIAESLVCQNFIEDYKKLSSTYYDKNSLRSEQTDFASTIGESAKVLKDKYAAENNIEKVKKADELLRCTRFIQKNPRFPSHMAAAQPLLDSIDLTKAPSKSVIERAASLQTSKLNQKDSWSLFTCEPCLAMQKYCLDSNGLFVTENAIALLRTIEPLHHAGKSEEFHIPETIHAKTRLIQACININKLKHGVITEAQKAEPYLK